MRVAFPYDLGSAAMLRWAVIFLLIGLVAGLLGFTGIAGASVAIAKTLFVIFLIIFLVFLIAGLTVARRVG
jgi:uncharacterized membrane protein YtjA (UPF0391 family)